MVAAQDPSPFSELCELPPDLLAKADLDAKPQARAEALIREFKKDVVFAERHLTKNLKQNSDYLVPEKDKLTLPSQAQATLGRYAMADTLAIYYRDRTHHAFVGLLAIAFLAMLVMEYFAHILPALFPIGTWPRQIAWLFPLLWFVAFGLWYYAHCQQYQEKYHDYRALAEGLRVHFFWELLDLDGLVEEHYLRKQRGELEWIRRAIACWRVRDQATPVSRPTSDQLTARKDLARRCWVKAQYDYFKRVGPREVGKAHRCKRRGAFLFWLSVGLSVILAVCEVVHLIHSSAEPTHEPPFYEEVLVFAIAMLLASAAIAIAYGEKMAFLEHARQYQGMENVYGKTDKQITEGPLTAEDAKLFRKLGEEALQENGDWLLIHRDRPLEVMVP